MKGLNGKKGLILAALVMASIFGAYAAQYYTWTVSYTINPLTSFETITIPKTTGATVGCACWGTPEVYAETIQIDKPLVVFFKVESGELTALATHYHSIAFSIHIFDAEDGLVEVLILPLVDEQTPCGCGVSIPELYITPDDAFVGIELGEGEYGIIKDVLYWTKAVDGEVGGSFTVLVFGVEEELIDVLGEHGFIW